MNCPTCGSIVQVEGNTTKYYVPLWQEERQALEARVKALETEVARVISLRTQDIESLQRAQTALKSIASHSRSQFLSLEDLALSCIETANQAIEQHGWKG
jgi:hypothetical protein